MTDLTPEHLTAGSPQSLANIVDCIKQTGGAVEVQGVRIEPCDERGETATTRNVTGLLDSLSEMEGKYLRALSLIHHLMRSRRRWQGEAFEHLFTYSLENTERVDTQRQLDAARARIHEWRVHLAEIVGALGLPEDTRFDCLPEEVRDMSVQVAALKLRLEPVDSPNFEALIAALGIDMTDPQEVLAEKIVQQRERIRELEAAQTPPLGYVAMARDKRTERPYGILPGRNFAIDKLTANMQRERFAKDEDMHVIVAELREVHDA